MEDQQNKMSFMDFRFGVNLATWLFHTLAITLNVFVRWGPGERSIGIPGLMIIPLLVLYNMLSEKYNSGPMWVFLLFYILLCCLWKAYAVFRRVILKRMVHTRYSGRPYLHLLCPWWNELLVKRIEPFIWMTVGCLVMKWNLPLGFYLVIAAGAQAGSLAISELIRLNLRLDAMDNRIEQQQNAEENRNLHGQ